MLRKTYNYNMNPNIIAEQLDKLKKHDDHRIRKIVLTVNGILNILSAIEDSQDKQALNHYVSLMNEMMRVTIHSITKGIEDSTTQTEKKTERDPEPQKKHAKLEIKSNSSFAGKSIFNNTDGFAEK